jgi:hypothetical protein
LPNSPPPPLRLTSIQFLTAWSAPRPKSEQAPTLFLSSTTLALLEPVERCPLFACRPCSSQGRGEALRLYTEPSRYDRRSSLELAPPSYLSSLPRVFLRLSRVRAVLNSRTRLSTRTHTRTRASTPVLAPKPSMPSSLASPPRCFPPLFVCPTGTRCAVP